MKFLTYMNTRRGRTIRFGVGLALAALGVVAGGWFGLVFMAFAALMVVTAVSGVCPISPLFGLPARSCSLPTRAHSPSA